MTSEIEASRAQFASMMSKQTTEHPLLQAELRELRHSILLETRAFPAPPAQPAPPRAFPKIKDILCRKLSEQEGYPGLSAGFEDFILGLKASVQVDFLEGNAARLFYSNVTQWHIDKHSFNYDDFKLTLRSGF
ncbi:hypothetical protein GN244_ATG10540 [Phytophthora infestans]|uniref:Uncharacterized protein n=1 Tax=Phytophthora infestans TaxID=4787 RepID=A0A833WCL3_PHYIN|nr:hypothetical protein GN244_ATG10540 [Phytophthora infestans]